MARHNDIALQWRQFIVGLLFFSDKIVVMESIQEIYKITFGSTAHVMFPLIW